ncbi:MAG: OadG family protein [Thiohalocapsa sp.]
MNESQMVIESLRLMGIGMGIVFSFLMLLVGVLRIMSSFALRIRPAETQPVAALSPTSPAMQQPDDLVAVISAAIARYRAHH